MSILDRTPLPEIEERHLQALIDNGVSEGIDLEFKEALYGGSDDDKREFLKDVTALANTAGGHIIIGIAARDGIAIAPRPITASPADVEKQRLESVLLASVEPRLVRFQIREVPLPDGYAFVLRVGRSWNPPHRVTFKGLNRYFLRHSAGVYEPSVEQLRAVFLGGAEAEKRLLEFRLERLARLRCGDRGVGLHAPGQLVLQAVPLGNDASAFEMPTVQTAMEDFVPPGRPSLTYRYNLDGLLLHSTADYGSGRTTSYTQIFRNGSVEMARGGYVRERTEGGHAVRLVVSGPLVKDLASGAWRCVDGARKWGVLEPIVVLVSFLDAEGSRLPPASSFSDASEPLDRRDILFSPLLIEPTEMTGDRNVLLAPVLDRLWNAYGHEYCRPARDAKGAWRGLADFRE